MKQLERGFWRTARTDKGISLMTTTGRRDMTRLSKYMGLGGDRKQPSWSKAANQHTCCGSKVSYRHKVNCENIK